MEHKCKKTDLKTVEKCELNREQIIKALEWCTSSGICFHCDENDNTPFLSKEGCMAVQMRNAISIIKELTEDLHATRTELTRVQEENERLRENNKQIVTDAVRSVSKLTEENERLNKAMDTMVVEHNFLMKYKDEQLENIKLEYAGHRGAVDAFMNSKKIIGHWVHSKRGFDVRGDYECSLCHSPEGIKHFYRGEPHYTFCPNCGAYMEGIKDD